MCTPNEMCKFDAFRLSKQSKCHLGPGLDLQALPYILIEPFHHSMSLEDRVAARPILAFSPISFTSISDISYGIRSIFVLHSQAPSAIER